MAPRTCLLLFLLTCAGPSSSACFSPSCPPKSGSELSAHSNSLGSLSLPPAPAHLAPSDFAPQQSLLRTFWGLTYIALGFLSSLSKETRVMGPFIKKPEFTSFDRSREQGKPDSPNVVFLSSSSPILLFLSGKPTSRLNSIIQPKTLPGGRGESQNSDSGFQMGLAAVIPAWPFCSPRSSVESSRWLIYLSFKTVSGY